MPATCQLRGPPFAPSNPMISCRWRMGKVALFTWHMSRSPEAYAPSVRSSIAEPPTTTSSMPCSAHSALHSDASLALLSVGSCSAVMSARADLILAASMIVSQPHRDALRGKMFLHVAHRELAEVEDARGEDGVGPAFEEHVGHVLQTARAAAGDDGHAHGFADAPRDHEVEARLGAVGVDAVEHDLARAELHRTLRPLDGVEARRLAAALRKDFPAIARDLPRVDGDDDALAAELLRAGADEIGRGERGGVDARLVRPGAEHRVHVVHGADAAADGQRHEAFVGHALDDLDHRLAPVRAGGDVEEHHLVGALRVVAQGERDGIADVAQFAGLGLAELHAAGDVAVVHVKAGDDAFGEHGGPTGNGRRYFAGPNLPPKFLMSLSA